MGVSTPTALLSLALCLSGGFQQGYVASVLNQPYIAVEEYINTSWIERFDTPIDRDWLNLIWSALNISYPLATILGQIIAATLCNRIGRKYTALLSCALYVPGIVLSFAAKYCHPAFELLFIGRLIWSVANGICIVNQTVWIVEAAPARHRGRMAAMQEVFMALGSLMTQALGVPFSTGELWPLMFVMPLFVNLISVCIFVFVHESPHYLLMNKKDPEKARRAFGAYHGTLDNDTIEEEMRQCVDSGQTTQCKKTKSGIETRTPENKVNGLQVMFNPWKASDPTSRVLRHAAWLGVMVKLSPTIIDAHKNLGGVRGVEAIAYVFTGARCIRAFSTFMLYDLGKWSYLDARYGSFGISLLRLPLTFVPVFTVDKIGRRPLLLGSMLASFAALSITMVSLDQGEAFKVGSLVGIGMLLLVTALGIGSVSRFYAAELVPRSLLLKATSILTIIEAVLKIVVEFSFFPLANKIGSHALLVFLGPTAAFVVLIWYYCPETKRKGVNDVLNEIADQKSVKVSFNV